MTHWLIYPPFADPTQPYGALPHLKGSLRAAGLDATILDLNVEAAHHVLGRGHVRICVERIATRFAQLNRRKNLNRLERMEYLVLADARDAAQRLLSANESPVEIFQDPARFYDFHVYRQARNLAEDAMVCTSAAHFPYVFNFNQAAHAAVPWGTALLENYFRQRHSPLDAFYRTHLFSGRLQPGDIVGINLSFISQLPEAFYLVKMARSLIPSVFTVMGGSCLQQVLAQAGDAARHWIVRSVDAACSYEGEQTLPLLIETLAGRDDPSPAGRFERLRRIPNLLLLDPGSDRLHATPLQRTDLQQQPAPDYADLDLDRYLAPERTVLFAPTRGCYWNRCAFCDYGLSRSECHGYREMQAGQAAAQLSALSQQYGVRHVYLSVDVMGPAFSVALAEALIALRSTICWSADFRIEKYYTQERCELLYRSGLRAVAFGVESGSDRMLRRMDKGLDTDLIRSVGGRFHQAGIATAWMTFSGHPGEDGRDALQTVRLIESEQHRIDLFILGRFGLTSGSRIAADPLRFGVRRVFYCKGDDLRLFPLFEGQNPLSPQAEGHLEKEVARLSRNYCLDHYPWAGAISTHHSLLYMMKFGQGVFRRLRLRSTEVPPDPGKKRSSPAGLTVRPRLSLDRLRGEQERRMHAFWQSALSAQKEAPAPLDEAFFLAFFQQF